MKKHYESKNTSEKQKPTDMYTDRKPSYASSAGASVDDRYDLTEVDGKIRGSSFTPMQENKNGLAPPPQDSENYELTIRNPNANEESRRASPEGIESTDDNLSVKSDSILQEKPPRAKQRQRSRTFNNDDASVASEPVSIAESERSLIPPRQQQQQQQQTQGRIMSDQEVYDQYFQQRMAKQQAMMPNGYIPRPELYQTPISHVHTNTSPQQYTQQRGPYATSPNSYNNQQFFHTLQPRPNHQHQQPNSRGGNLHPQTAGRRKISAQSNPGRFVPPSSPTNRYRGQQQPQNKRHHSPNRGGNHGNNKGGLGQYNNYSDAKGRPLSMSDLRILEEVSRHPGHDRKRARSVEDILALHDDRAISEVSASSGGVYTGRKKKPVGMWAQTQARH